ncbi:MAG: translation initiation factor [Bacteroidales bacterium]|nr:translation initiation factor [Bacteroidales bacterium]
MKKEGGIVFSTNPDFKYETASQHEAETLPANRQQLRIWIESKGRKGKTVTIVKGFVGRNDDLEMLAKELKTICGSGGSVKDGAILIQGNFRDKINDHLNERGYQARKAGR